MKLKPADQPKIFYQVAHRLIVLQKGQFTKESLLKQYYAKCSSYINLEYAKKILLGTLDDLVKKGIVKTNPTQEETYFTIFNENDSLKDKLKEELSQDESWIIMY